MRSPVEIVRTDAGFHTRIRALGNREPLVTSEVLDNEESARENAWAVYRAVMAAAGYTTTMSATKGLSIETLDERTDRSTP